MELRDLPRPVVFWDTGCPFAHRILALLVHLGVPFDSEEAAHGQRPAALASWSASGRIPFFVQGDLAIGESRVILEYLTEAYGFRDGWPPALRDRTLHRQAMALVDLHVVPSVFHADAAPGAARLAEILDALEATVDRPAAPGLLAFHVAPVWLRLLWWRPEGAVTRAMSERPALRAWLDEVAALSAVAATSPPADARVWR